MKVRIMLLILSGAVLACGGGGGSPVAVGDSPPAGPPAPPTPPPPAPVLSIEGQYILRFDLIGQCSTSGAWILQTDMLSTMRHTPGELRASLSAPFFGSLPEFLYINRDNTFVLSLRTLTFEGFRFWDGTIQGRLTSSGFTSQLDVPGNTYTIRDGYCGWSGSITGQRQSGTNVLP
jgi:hypothetical protein